MSGAILALDLATRTGWAILTDGGRIHSGTTSFALRKHEGAGQLYMKFRNLLLFLKQANPSLSRIVYERVSGPTRSSPQIYCGLLAMLEVFGEQHQISYDGIYVMTVKKAFCGSGRATKEDVIAQCRLMGFKPEDDNEADAIALLHIATGNAPVLTPPPLPKRAAKSLKAAGSLPAQPF